MTQLSELTGFDRRTIKARLSVLKAERVEGKSHIYDAQKALPILYKLETDDVKEQMMAESLRLEKARADKIELELAKTRGEQCAIEDVATVVSSEYTNVRARLLSIPSKLAIDTAQTDDPRVTQNLMADAINEALAELSADEKYKQKEVPEINSSEGGDDEGNSSN